MIFVYLLLFSVTILPVWIVGAVLLWAISPLIPIVLTALIVWFIVANI